MRTVADLQYRSNAKQAARIYTELLKLQEAPKRDYNQENIAHTLQVIHTLQELWVVIPEQFSMDDVANAIKETKTLAEKWLLILEEERKQKELIDALNNHTEAISKHTQQMEDHTEVLYNNKF